MYSTCIHVHLYVHVHVQYLQLGSHGLVLLSNVYALHLRAHASHSLHCQLSGSMWLYRIKKGVEGEEEWTREGTEEEEKFNNIMCVYMYMYSMSCTCTCTCVIVHNMPILVRERQHKRSTCTCTYVQCTCSCTQACTCMPLMPYTRKVLLF